MSIDTCFKLAFLTHRGKLYEIHSPWFFLQTALDPGGDGRGGEADRLGGPDLGDLCSCCRPRSAWKAGLTGDRVGGKEL